MAPVLGSVLLPLLFDTLCYAASGKLNSTAPVVQAGPPTSCVAHTPVRDLEDHPWLRTLACDQVDATGQRPRRCPNLPHRLPAAEESPGSAG